MKLMVVIASVREERVGPAIARWFVERAEAHGTFELDVVDLKEVALPMLDEPTPPALPAVPARAHQGAGARASTPPTPSCS